MKYTDLGMFSYVVDILKVNIEASGEWVDAKKVIEFVDTLYEHYTRAPKESM